MKCKACLKPMTHTLINYDFQQKNIKKKAFHVPAFTCPNCNNVFVPDRVLNKLNAYAKLEKGSTIDYKHYEKEEASIFTIFHTFGFGG